MVFPLYHVLADACKWRGAELLDCTSADPLRMAGLAVRAADGMHVLLANVTSIEQAITLGPLITDHVVARQVNETSASRASDDPERFRAERRTLETRAGELSFSLPPYGVARLDAV